MTKRINFDIIGQYWVLLLNIVSFAFLSFFKFTKGSYFNHEHDWRPKLVFKCLLNHEFLGSLFIYLLQRISMGRTALFCLFTF